MHSAIKRSRPDWLRIFAGFRAVPLASLAEACSTILAAWAAVGEEILAHLATVYEHWLEFEQEITKSLESSS